MKNSSHIAAVGATHVVALWRIHEEGDRKGRPYIIRTSAHLSRAMTPDRIFQYDRNYTPDPGE
jgi:hypothetical protein